MRPNLAAPLVAAIALVGTGCGAYGERLVNREVVVHFAADATPAQHEAARSACSSVPRTSPEPAPSSTLESVRRADVRFAVGAADDADLARLYDCLRKQPGVVGVEIPAQM